MRRTTTLRALAGAAALLLAGAGPALASSTPSDEDWVEQLEADGVSDVTCHLSVFPAGSGSSTIYLEESTWAPVLADGHEWLKVVLRAEDEPTMDLDFAGYGLDNPYEMDSGSLVTQVLACQGDPDGEEAAEEPTEEPAPEPTEAPTDEEEATDEAEADEPSGPPVETDGPATEAGPNLGLMGGAALALAGAGVAGYALRRRDGGRH